MPEVAFNESLRALAAKDPKPYEEIFQLYQAHAPQVAHHHVKLSAITYDVMEYITPGAVLTVLIPIPAVSDQYVEYLFWIHMLGNAEKEDIATVLRLLSTHRYNIFEAIATKNDILDEVEEAFPDVLDLLLKEAEA